MLCAIPAANGQDSLLFASLQQAVGETRALEIYYQYISKADSFLNLPKDANGEPEFTAFVQYKGLNKPTYRELKTLDGIPDIVRNQIQTLMSNWNIDVTKVGIRYGQFGISMTDGMAKKMVNHYNANPAAEQYSNISLRYYKTYDMLAIYEKVPPEIDTESKFMALPTLNIYSTDVNGFNKLSNFHNGPFTINGRTYQTVEHAYQYAKAFLAGDKALQDKILNSQSGAAAKVLGGAIKLTPEQEAKWQASNIDTMKMLMKTAFDQNPEQRELLLRTGNVTLTHIGGKRPSIWDKKFPELLMGLRDEYQQTAEADRLTPIEQNFTDGQGGRRMQPQFTGKSTMDLIISGDRTRTTRAKTDIERMLRDYNLEKIEDLVGKIIRMSDNKGRTVYTHITAVNALTQEYQDATWQKEGWEKSVTDSLVGKYPYAIEFEVFKPGTKQQQKAMGFTNHSGGATGSDAAWDIIGREFGVTDHRHYREPASARENGSLPETVDSPELTKAGVKSVDLEEETFPGVYTEGQSKATIAARQMGRIEETHNTRSNYIIRNWAQVKYADAVFALGTIIPPGTPMKNGKVAKIEQVKGGTGYAVQMAINENKPVYVYDGTKDSWFKYDPTTQTFVKTDTPTLTQNFAGIGSRSLATEGVWQKSLQAIRDVYAKTFDTAPQSNVKLTSNPLSGVVAADTQLSIEQSKEFLKILEPQILNQAYIENRATTANAMFSLGLRWARIIPGEWELSKQGANLGVPRPNRVSIKSMGDGTYGYFTTDQNNNPLPSLSSIQPIIDYLSTSLGIDMNEYDAMLGNIYDEKSFIHQHRDITEDQSAEKFPVIVLNLGASGSLVYSNDPVKPYNGFTVDGELPLKNGSAYAFGVEGKNRFTFHHRIASGLTSANPLPSIQIPTWDKYGNRIGTKTLDNYRITLTFRRASPTTNTAGPKLAQNSVLKGAQPTTQNSEQSLKVRERINTLPIEISRSVTVLDDVPDHILGNPDVYLSLKDVLADNGITDPILVNWVGINKDSVGHPKMLRSKQDIDARIEKALKAKLDTEKYVEFKTNPLAVESFNAWVEQLKFYPPAFQDIMLGHAIKHIVNPNKKSKYVLQLSKVALQNTFGIMMNKPHEMNRLGRLYDMEVLNTISDALEHEPSASGKGYWVHVPRVSLESMYAVYNTRIEDITEQNNPKGKFIVRSISMESPTEEQDYFNTLEEAQAFVDVLNPPTEKGLQERHKTSVDLLRKLSPSTWCTAGYMTEHYVQNFDNYILVVNGVTVAGIEAYPQTQNLKGKLQLLDRLELLDTRIENGDGDPGDYHERDTIQRQLDTFSIEGKRQVKEVTSRANNGTASVDHLDDILAFFEKHNLNSNNESVKKAIAARDKGVKDIDLQEVMEDDGAWNPNDDLDPRYAEEYIEYEQEQERYINMVGGELITANTEERVLDIIADNDISYQHFNAIPQEFRTKEVYKALIAKDSHAISAVDPTADYYMELAKIAMSKSPFIYNYLSADAKLNEEILKLHNEQLAQNIIDDLPFSKTMDTVQGYYDPRTDEVVVIANNIKVEEADKIAIHEVAHRGMLRMAKDLGGLEALMGPLEAAEQQLMEKLPELLKRTGHATLNDLMLDYGFTPDSREGKAKLLMELAARWAETLTDKPKPSWWKQLLASIKDWVAQFTGKTLNEQEVNELVGGFVRYGTKESTNKGGHPIANTQEGIKVYTGEIKGLGSNQVFVFGANDRGLHGRGAAGYAMFNTKEGRSTTAVEAMKTGTKGTWAVLGEHSQISQGLLGKSYGMITVRGKLGGKREGYRIDAEDFRDQIAQLYKTAMANPDKEFLVAYSGFNPDRRSLNGYTPREMASLFDSMVAIPENIVFEQAFASLLINSSRRSVVSGEFQFEQQESRERTTLNAQRLKEQQDLLTTEIVGIDGNPTGNYFSAEQMISISGMMKRKMLEYLVKNKGMKNAYNKILEDLKVLHERQQKRIDSGNETLKMFGGIAKAQELNNNLLMVINSYKDLFNNVKRDLLSYYGIDFKTINQARGAKTLTQDEILLNEDGSIVDSESSMLSNEDSGREMYGQLSEMIDPRDTMTGRVKLMLSVIKEAEYGQEDPVAVRTLSISSPELRKLIATTATEQNPIILPRAASQQGGIGIFHSSNPKINQGQVVIPYTDANGEKVSSFRVTAVGLMTQEEADEFNTTYIASLQKDKDGNQILAKVGDVKYKIEPFKVRDRVLRDKIGWTGQPQVADMESVFQSALAVLHNVEPSAEAVIAALKDAGKANGTLARLAETLAEVPEHYRNEFISVVRKQNQNFKTILLRANRRKNVPITVEVRSIDSNRGSAQRVLVDAWKESQKMADIVKRTDAGEFLINQEKLNELRTEMESLYKAYQEANMNDEVVAQGMLKDATDFVSKVLTSNGIMLSDEMLNDLVTNIGELSKNKERLTGATIFDHMRYGNDGKPLGFISIILSRLGDAPLTEDDAIEAFEESEISKNNFLYSDKDITDILSNLYIKYSGTISTQSFRNVNGDVVYAYGHPTYLSDEFGRIKDKEHRDKLSVVPYIKNNFFFRHLERGEDINLQYVDGFSMIGKAAGTERSAMSPREQEIDYVNRILRTETKGDFYSLTHSDKTRTPMFANVVRVSVTQGEGYTQAILSEFVHLFNAEFNRIRNGYKNEGVFNHDKYEQGNKQFYLTPFNYKDLKALVDKDVITAEELAMFYTENGEHTDIFKNALPDAAQTPVIKVLTHFMNELVKLQLEKWNSINFMEGGLPLVHKGYISKMLRDKNIRVITNKKGRTINYIAYNSEGQIIPDIELTVESVNTELTRVMAMDVALNSYVVNAAATQALYGDPAQFFKGNIETTLVEYQKRLAGPIAPHRAMVIGPEESYRAITIKDLKVGLNINHPAYKKGINVADGQEYITMEEWLYTSFHEGQITREEYDAALKAVKSANGGYYTLDKVLEGKILGVTKPVYYGNTEITAGNAIFKQYIKSSALPLYPPFTENFELDKLRKYMETNNIRRAHFESARKTGPGTVAKVFNDDGTVNTDAITPQSIQTYSRRNLGIQQDNPYNEDKKAIAIVSQENKLITSTVDSEASFKLTNRDALGAEGIRNYREDIRIEMITRKMAKFNEEFGIEDGSITDPKKAYGKLAQLAKDNGVYPDELLMMKTDANGSPFIHPFFLPSSKKYEALILSALKKTTQVKITGKSYVQASAAGITKLVESSDANLNGVVWVKDVKELSFATKKDGKVSPAQVLVPFNFFSGDSKLKLEDVMTDGKIDMEKLPAELLNMIGARIPNQGHNSMLPIEIVGFLPANMGDVIVVPNGITAQMGSDFDVDKLYIYQRPYTAENGILKVPTLDGTDVKNYTDKQLEHEYFDIHWAILTDPSMYERLISPLDKPDLVDESGKFGKISRAPFFSAVRQLSDYQLQVDAKALVGLSSLATTFNAVIQNKDLVLGSIEISSTGNSEAVRRFITVHDKNGNPIRLGNLSGNATSTYDGETRTKHDNITTMQSAFLDNAKDPYSGKLNITLSTWPAAYAMVQLQTDNEFENKEETVQQDTTLNLKYVTRLLSHPIIREYNNRLSVTEDNLSDFTEDSQVAVIDKLEQELRKKYGAATIEQINDMVQAVVFNEETLEDMNKINAFPANKEDIIKVIAVLRKFNEFREVGVKLIELNSLFNQDTQGAGGSIITALDKKAKYTTIMQQDIILNTESLISYKGRQTEQGFLYESIIDNAVDSLELMFPHATLTDMFNKIRLQGGKEKLSTKQQEEIVRSIKAFVFSNQGLGIYPGDVRSERARLLFDTPQGPSLAKRVMKALNTSWGKDNYLLQRLYTSLSLSEGDYVAYRATSASGVDDINNKRAWTDLLTSNDKEANLLGEDLIRYTYIMGGVQDNNSFVKYIPTAYIQSTQISAFLERVHGMKGALQANLNDSTFIAQYFQHFPERTVGLSNELKEIGGNEPTTYFNLSAVENQSNSHLFVFTGTGRVPANFVHYRDSQGQYRLYQLVETTATNLKYVQVDTLGNKTVYEFNAAAGYTTKSIIPKNKSLAKMISKVAPTKTEITYTEVDPLVVPEWANIGIRKLEMTYAESLDVMKSMETNEKVPFALRGVAKALHQMHLEEDMFSEGVATETPFLTLGDINVPGKLIGGETNGRIDKDGTFLSVKLNNSPKVTQGAETFLHEMVHVGTLLLFRYEEQSIKNPSSRSAKRYQELIAKYPQVPQLLKDLNDTRNEAIRKFDKGQLLLDGYTTNEIFNIEYALSEAEEFLVGAMTSPVVAKWLNSIKDTRNKSLFQKLVDAIAELVATLGNALTEGNYNPNSLLGSALRSVVPIVKYRTFSGDFIQNNIQKFTSEAGIEYTIVTDDDGNVSQVFELVNGVAVSVFDFEDIIKEWKGDKPPVNKPGKYEIAPGIMMNAEQITAVDLINDFLTGVDSNQNGIHEIVLSGAGGTGKTTILKKILEGYKGNRKIKYLAPSHNARLELSFALKSNAPMTLQSGVRYILDRAATRVAGKDVFKKNTSALKKIFPGDIVVLDESSMVSDELIKELMDEMDGTGIVIYTGDHAQLSPTEHSSSDVSYPFRNKNLPRATLIQNMRSGKEDITRIVDQMRSYVDVTPMQFKPLDKRVNSDNVKFVTNHMDIVNSFISSFKAKQPGDLFDSVVVTYRNKTRQWYNDTIRTMLFGQQIPEFVPGDYLRINRKSISITPLAMRNTVAVDPANANTVAGMLKNKEIEDALTANERFFVREWSGEKKIKEILIKSLKIKINIPFEEMLIERRAGLGVNVLTTLDFIRNGDMQNFITTVGSTFNKAAGSTVSLDVESAIAQEIMKVTGRDTIHYGEFMSIVEELESLVLNYEYAYSATSHNVQGSSYNNVYVIESDIEAVVNIAGVEDVMRSMYVAVSRSKNNLTILHEARNKGVLTAPTVKQMILPRGSESDPNAEYYGDNESEWVTKYMAVPPPINSADNRHKVLTEILRKLNNAKTTLTKQISEVAKESPAARADRKVRQQRLENDIATIQAQMQLNNIAVIGKDHLEWVDRLLNKPNIDSKDVMMAYELVSIWAGMSETMGILDGQDRQGLNETELNDISGEANRLRGKMFSDTFLTHLMANTTLTIKDLKNIEDEDKMSSAARSLNSAKGKLAQTLGKLYTDSSRMVEEQAVSDSFELQDLDSQMEKYAKAKGIKKEAVQSMFLRPINGGVALLNEYSPAWYTALHDVRRTRDKVIKDVNSIPALFPDRKRLIKQAYSDYWNTMKAISHTVDIRNIVDITTGAVVKGANYDAEIAKLKTVYGNDTTALIQQAVDKYKRFLEDQQEFFLSIDTSADQKIDSIKNNASIIDKQGEIDKVNSEYRIKEKQLWSANNSPLQFLDSMIDAKFDVINKGDRYVITVPNKAKFPQYYDSNYDTVMNDAELKTMFDYVKGKVQHYLGMLPYDDTKNLVPNFFPLVDKTLMREGLPIGQQVVNFIQDGLNSISSSPGQEQWRADREFNTLPVNYLYRDKDKEFSTDISRVLEVFGRMANHFRHMSNVKELAEVGETLLLEHNARVIRGLEPGKSITNLLESLRYTRESIMYKRAKRLQGNTGVMIFKTKSNPWSPSWIIEQRKAKKEWDALKVETNKLNKDRANGDITDTEYYEAMEKVNAKVATLQTNSRTIYGSQIGDKLINIQQAKSLSYNPFSAFANWSFGFVSALNYSQGARGLKEKAEFDSKSFRKAWGTVSSSISSFFNGGDKKRGMKIYRIMELMGVMGDVVDSTYGETAMKTKRNKVPDALKPYAMMRSGDYNIRASVLVASMMYRKAKVINKATGAEEYIPIWDLFDAEGKFRDDDFTSEGWQEGDVADRVEWNKFKNRINKALYTIMGNTDKNATKYLKAGIWGRMIAQFRLSWIPEGIASRFMDERDDLDLERKVKGRWREYSDIGFGNSITILYRMALERIGMEINPFEGIDMLTGNVLEDHNKENMYRNFSGLIWTIGVVLTGLIIKSIAMDDDDDEKSDALMVLINTLYRLQQDLLFYSSSDVATTLTGNAIPALRVLTDYKNAINATWKAFDEDNYDWDQAVLKWTKAGIPIPQAALINKFKFMTTRELSTISR